jgi:hypothetical protein
MSNHRIIFALLFSLAFGSLSAQDSLMAILGMEDEDPIQYTYATFKSTRVVTGQSVERMKARQLEFRISHRFGRLNSGSYEAFGLDQSTIHYGLEYGVTDWFTVGIGRGTFEKTSDAFYKFTLLRQSKGKRFMPVSLSYVGSIAVNGMHPPTDTLTWFFTNRLSYCHQLLIARKFNDQFSLQLSPTYVHRNYVKTETDPNDVFALGIAGRYKLTKRISVNGEYYLAITPGSKIIDTPIYNPLSFGFDIETGGHVFQIHLTNSLGMIDKSYITQTTGQWKHGDLHLGFNISRVFSF